MINLVYLSAHIQDLFKAYIPVYVAFCPYSWPSMSINYYNIQFCSSNANTSRTALFLILSYEKRIKHALPLTIHE